ncbi:hypothetical protein GQ457_15G009330 [Hibiscus cannabinus]
MLNNRRRFTEMRTITRWLSLEQGIRDWKHKIRGRRNKGFRIGTSGAWIRKYQKYFNIFIVHETQKLELATMYLIDKFTPYIMIDLTQNLYDINDFNKFFQETTVDEYQEQFEALTPFMLQQNDHLNEAYFVSNFISGFKDEIKHKVKVQEPKASAEACKKKGFMN